MGMLLVQQLQLRTLMKWSLKVPINFLAKFIQWSSGGMSSYVIFDTDPSDSVVDSTTNFMRAEHWLSRIWCFGTIPCLLIRLGACIHAAMSKPSV